MELKEIYNKLPYDTSGSMAKNRFEYELIFGLSKLYEYYDVYEEYAIVFDYVCDIELHINNQLSFFQIKTNGDYKPITTTFLTKRKKENLPSIIGKLYSINCVENIPKDKMKLNIVGNVPFRDEKILHKLNVQKFTDMSVETQNKIIESLKKELDQKEIKLDNLYYIYSPMDLVNYDYTMLGKTLKFYNKVMGIDPKKPNVLYSTLKSIIHEKASCEEKDLAYEELITKKAIIKKELTQVLSCHKQSNDLIEKCLIELKKKFPSIREGLLINIALKRIVDENDSFYEIEKVKLRKIIENEFLDFDGNEDDFIERIITQNMNDYPNDYSYYDKYTFVEYEILKYMEEIYEKNHI